MPALTPLAFTRTWNADNLPCILHPRSGAASSEDASSSATAIGSWPQDLTHPHGSNPRVVRRQVLPQFGYTSEIPPVPLPPGSPSYPQGEAYPLQSEIQQQHRVLHSHIFKEVVAPPQSGRPNRLMVTEVDRWGEERNRQPEFFFNGIVGHEILQWWSHQQTAGIKPPD